MTEHGEQREQDAVMGEAEVTEQKRATVAE